MSDVLKNNEEQPSRGARRLTHSALVLLGAITGGLLVTAPTACGVERLKVSREPLVQSADPQASDDSRGFDESRLDVGGEIEERGIAERPSLDSESFANIYSDKELFALNYDRNFCSGLSADECLTFVIQVPGTMLQSSLGLGALGLALSSKGYRDLLHRTCSEGLQVGLPVIEAGLALHRRNGTARRMFTKFKRSRCIYQVLTDESERPPALATNETGIKVRLVDFSLNGTAISSNPVIGRFEFNESQMVTAFHDVAIRGPQATAPNDWQPVRGGWNPFDTATYSGIFKTSRVNVVVNRGLVFKANGFGIASYLNTVLEPFLDDAKKTEALVKANAQIEMMRMAVKSLRQGRNMVTSSLILVGMGFDAIKQLCNTPGSSCKVQGNGKDLVSELNTAFENGEPLDSNSKALLIDALKYVPVGLLRAVYTHADEKALQAQLIGSGL